MTETSQVWDGILIGDATVSPYSAVEWAAREELLHGQSSVFPNYGVLKGTGGGTYDPLFVAAKSPASTNIEIEIGSALVAGILYQNTAAVTLVVGANASGNPRIDTVILRADYVAQTVRIVLKQGTPAGSPARPALTQSIGSTFEIPLADVAVANGFAVINQADITNRQRSIHSLTTGWMPYAYHLNYQVNGSYDAASLAVGLNQAVAIPFLISANMLVQDVIFRNVVAVNYLLNWGLYIQDVNDGNTAENTARLVASGTGTGAAGGPANVIVPASPAPQVVSPGLYWLVLQSSGGAGSITIGRIANNALQQDSYILHAGATINAITQTMDLVTGWAAGGNALGIYIRGRVLGQTVVF